MSEFDFDESKVVEGLLEVNLDMSPHQQFNSWMMLKGVNITSQTNNTSNLIQTIILDNNEGKKNTLYDRCFSKSSYNRGGGYDKGSFDRICI